MTSGFWNWEGGIDQWAGVGENHRKCTNEPERRLRTTVELSRRGRAEFWLQRSRGELLLPEFSPPGGSAGENLDASPLETMSSRMAPALAAGGLKREEEFMGRKGGEAAGGVELGDLGHDVRRAKIDGAAEG